MSSKHIQDEGLNDADIEALFSADKFEPPSALDKAVLAQAHGANPSAVPFQRKETFIEKYAPLFGTAAVLVIGIALAPLMMQQPEYALDTNTVSTDTAPATASQRSDSRQSTVITQKAERDKVAKKIAAEPAERILEQSNNVHDSKPLVESVDADNQVEVIASTNGTEDVKEAIKNKVQVDTLAEEQASPAPHKNAVAQLAEPVKEPATKADAPGAAASVNTTAPREITSYSAPTAQIAGISAPEAETENNAPSISQIESDSATLVRKQKTIAVTKATAESQSAVSVNKDDEQHVTQADNQSENTLGLGLDSSVSSFAAQEPNTLSAQAAAAPAPGVKLVDGAADESLSDADSAELAYLAKSEDNKTSNSSTRKRPKNYTSSPLLWVLEIKQLFSEGNREKAIKELNAFREKHPRNNFEKLLPEELQQKTDK